MVLSTASQVQPLGREPQRHLPSYYAPRNRCYTSMNTCNRVRPVYRCKDEAENRWGGRDLSNYYVTVSIDVPDTS